MDVELLLLDTILGALHSAPLAVHLALHHLLAPRHLRDDLAAAAKVHQVVQRVRRQLQQVNDALEDVLQHHRDGMRRPHHILALAASHAVVVRLAR